MANSPTTGGNGPANDLLDRWMAHHQRESGDVEPEPISEPDEVIETVEVIRTVEAFEEFAHPAPALGGASGAPSPSGPETVEEGAPLSAPAPAPVTTGASVPHQAKPHQAKPPTPVRRPTAAPAPGLVLFSPRRGLRHVLTATAALLAAGVGVAGYLAWLAQTPTSFGVAGGMVAALLLVWKVRGRTNSTHITIENGMLRIEQGKSRHLFPLASAHPPIDIIGEPGRRSWKVLIQRRGMPPFVITRKMVEPVGFSEAIRHFRPDA